MYSGQGTCPRRFIEFGFETNCLYVMNGQDANPHRPKLRKDLDHILRIHSQRSCSLNQSPIPPCCYWGETSCSPSYLAQHVFTQVLLVGCSSLSPPPFQQKTLLLITRSSKWAQHFKEKHFLERSLQNTWPHKHLWHLWPPTACLFPSPQRVPHVCESHISVIEDKVTTSQQALPHDLVPRHDHLSTNSISRQISSRQWPVWFSSPSFWGLLRTVPHVCPKQTMWDCSGMTTQPGLMAQVFPWFPFRDINMYIFLL